jgi:hypothetical protein
MVAQMVAYDAQIRVLEGFRLVTFGSEVINVMAPEDLESPTRVIVRSSVHSQLGNNILFLFLI